MSLTHTSISVKGLMMLTNDAPSDVLVNHLIGRIRDWNRAFNDAVLILTYGIGNS